MTRLALLMLLLAAGGCVRPLYARWEPEVIEPKTKYVIVDGNRVEMTQKEFDVWIRDQQMRGAL